MEIYPDESIETNDETTPPATGQITVRIGDKEFTGPYADRIIGIPALRWTDARQTHLYVPIWVCPLMLKCSITLIQT